MSKTCDTIDIDNASAGMVLGADLHDSRGGVLLPIGAALSEATIVSLRRRGIEQLCVVVQVAPQAPAGDAALELERNRQCARLQRLFRRHSDAGANDALLERLLEYRSGGRS
jgi:hypothetical protein